MEDHECHVCLVLEKLWEFGLFTKLEKSEFHQSEVEFLGYVIFGDGIRMDLYKVQTIVDWILQLMFKMSDVSWICQVLLTFHCPLFFNSASYLID
jgi:hypothetical protein